MPINDLTFLHGSQTSHCTAVVDKRFDGYYSLQLMERGRLRIAYGDEEQICEGLWAWPAFPGPRIRFACVERGESWHHRYIAFQGPRVQHWRSGGIWPERPQPLADRSLLDRMDALHHLLAEGGRWNELRAINLLEAMLIDLAADGQARQSEAWLASALAALDRCRDLRPDCIAIAAGCGLGPIAFQRRFKAQMGCTPVAYLRERRIARARELLATTDTGLEAIADTLGYADQYYFSRHFKQCVGVPPGRYRSSVRQLTGATDAG